MLGDYASDWQGKLKSPRQMSGRETLGWHFASIGGMCSVVHTFSMQCCRNAALARAAFRFIRHHRSP
jgi:hypothetical protein